MTIKINKTTSNKIWYYLGNNYMRYDTRDGSSISYTRHYSEAVESFIDRMIQILYKNANGRLIK